MNRNLNDKANPNEEKREAGIDSVNPNATNDKNCSKSRSFSDTSSSDGVKRKRNKRKKLNKKRKSVAVSTTSDDGECSETESDDSVGVGKSLLVREIPKITKFNVNGVKSIGEFFQDFERYCKCKFPDHPSY